MEAASGENATLYATAQGAPHDSGQAWESQVLVLMGIKQSLAGIRATIAARFAVAERSW
jgi:hypothetical protein